MGSIPPRSVLVLGAGELGTPILRSLSSHALRKETCISVLLRQTTIESTSSSKKAQVDALKVLGVTLIQGDVVADSHVHLVSLFRQYEVVVGATGMTFPPGTQTRILEAILEAKVPLYVPWRFGLDYDAIGHGSAQNLFTEQLDIRNALRSQISTKWIIVSTGIFMSFMFEPAFGVVEAGKGVVYALGSWENSVTLTTVEDIGKVTADIILESSSSRDCVVFSAGEIISYGRLADVVEAVKGSKMKRVLWDLETLEIELRKDPENGMKKYRIVLAEGKGVS